MSIRSGNPAGWVDWRTLCRRSRSHGQSEGKLASSSWFTLQRDFPALLFDETFRDRQSQSRAFSGIALSVFNLAEFLKNDCLILSSNADPCIGYRYANFAPVSTAIDVDSAVPWSELNRVAEQVIKNLFKTHSISMHGEIRLEAVLNLDILCHGQRTNSGENLRQSILNLKIFAPEFQLSGFDFREVENVID